MSIYSLIPLLSSILFLTFGLFVFLKNKRSVVNITFALICLVTFWWQFSLCILFNVKSEALAGYLVKIAYMGIIFIPIFFFHFYISFLGKVKKFDKFLLYFSYLSGFLFEIILIRTDYLVEGFYEYFWGFYPKAGILHPIYLALLAFLACRILYLLFFFMRKNSPEPLSPHKYGQTKYALWAIIFYTLAASDFFINYGFEFYPFGVLFILASLGIFAYSIIKYRLMDISWVLGRTGVYILSFSSIIFYVFLFSLISQKFGYVASPIIVNIFISVTSILLFIYIFPVFEKLAAKYFYYTLYSLRQALQLLSEQLNKTINLDQSINLISRSLLDALDLDRISIILKRPEDSFRADSSIKFDEKEILSLLGKQDNFLMQYLKQTKKPLVKDEISYIIREPGQREKNKLAVLEEDMDAVEAGLCLPLLIEEELIGVIILGDKLTRNSYTTQDLNLLIAFSVQASVVLNSALAYEEINQRKADLEKFYKLTVGRELKMAELKKKIRDMENREK